MNDPMLRRVRVYLVDIRPALRKILETETPNVTCMQVFDTDTVMLDYLDNRCRKIALCRNVFAAAVVVLATWLVYVM